VTSLLSALSASADDGATGLELPAISDDYVKGRLQQSRDYTLLMLRRTAKLKRPEVDPVIWEHGRRNMALQQAGLMPIVCPVRDQHSEYAGIGLLTVPVERAAEIISEDPGVKAGIFTFEMLPVGGFPGSALPTETQAAAHALRWQRWRTRNRSDWRVPALRPGEVHSQRWSAAARR
jgi:hypothetical protein